MKRYGLLQLQLGTNIQFSRMLGLSEIYSEAQKTTTSCDCGHDPVATPRITDFGDTCVGHDFFSVECTCLILVEAT